MADINDSMNARRDADNALSNLQAFGGRLEDQEDSQLVGGSGPMAMAVLLAGEAICKQLEALSVHADYVARDLHKRSGAGTRPV